MISLSWTRSKIEWVAFRFADAGVQIRNALGRRKRVFGRFV
jgi:hypothetical protein